ncbi:nose resistant to fluoxetine protein 6 [Rhipicephalus sanguineus]|uniref:nose resistant to fluoxetine protein 6 n=1 Tax=Rhipicephalus sanguineus TaxID=34632 RepID=UPI0020C2CF2A|nr:nose resistant to fluoxetine protein 6 [Rhipicephalus sanguineus]
MMRLSTCVVIVLLCAAAATVAATSAPSTEAAMAPTQPSLEHPPAAQPTPELVQALKGVVNDFLGSPRSPLTRRLIAAKVSSGCTVGLMKLLRAFRNMEPWAYRLLDATGKYPTGLLQGTLSDVGAFDECIETVVRDYYGRETARAQYCNVYLDGNATEVLRYLTPAIIMSHPRAIDFALESGNNRFVEGVRIGLCFITDCTQKDIQSLLQSLVHGTIDLDVKDCVTSLKPPMTKTQTLIVVGLGVLAAGICVSTAFDIYLSRTNANTSFLVKLLTTFSLRLNLETLLVGVNDKESDAYMYRFFHGLRFFSMFMIVFGHSYNIFDFINTSRMVNALHYADSISFSLVMTGYLSVDVFFFLSGFLLAYNIEPKRDNILLTGLIAIVRRHIRTTAPVFFAMVCCLLVPQIASGPNLKPLMEKFYYEFRNQWCHILLQVRNLYSETEIGMFGHLWFVAADFQLFIWALPTILILKRHFWALIAAFFSFSLLCCSVTAWQVVNTPYPPFMTPIVADISILLDTLNYVYVLPFYHGMCYFAGCVTYFLLKKYGQVKISQMKQIGMWCLTLTCALATVFLKYDWNRGRGPPGEWIKIPLAFIDRLMWSFCIGWTVFACSTRRGGVLWNFLSWRAFVPLSRLCFGIYIVHVPLFFIKSNIARERIFYSHFTLVLQTFAVFVTSSLLSLTIYLACEAPVGRLEKMFLMPNRKEEKAHRVCRGKQINIMRKLPCTIKDTDLVNTKEQKPNIKEYSSRL